MVKSFCIQVWGDYACFTRPEMKVERVSYDIITPSAARAIFEAILWKPAIRWRIDKIEVLKPIRWFSIRRNEVSKVASYSNVKSAIKSGTGHLGLYIEDERQQRAGLVLQDVAYRLYGHFEMVPEHMGSEDSEGKFCAMFERRAKQGQSFNQPYFGCREFSAHFEWVSPDTPDLEAPIAENKDLGWMLYDLDFSKPEPTPRFFNAVMKNGTIQVPAWESEEVRG